MTWILGIDTSNYTTSAALYSIETGEILQEKQLIPVPEGACGVRQNDVLFHHTKQLPEIFDRLIPKIHQEPILAVGASSKPRGEEGSYMPCFLAGEGAARMIASVQHIPYDTTTHQMGHVLAGIYSANRSDLLTQPFFAFHVSGGTTDLLYCCPDSSDILKITRIGTSLDLKAGQAIDRIGVMLGLDFPCGIALEKLAQKSDCRDFMTPTIRDGNCCLSGLENKCQKMQAQNQPAEDIAAYCLNTVAETICAMLSAAQKNIGSLPVLFAGGVMSDRFVRPRLLQQTSDGSFAEPEFSADNAAGVAIFTALRFGETIWHPL